MKRFMILVLTIVMCFSFINLPTKAYAATSSDFLSDVMAQDFVNLFWSNNEEMASGIKDVLTGKEPATTDHIMTVYSVLFDMFDVATNDTELFRLQIEKDINFFKNMNSVAMGIMGIIENGSSFAFSDNDMQKTIDGFQICFDVMDIVGYGSSIPSGASFALSAIEVGLEVGGILEKAYLAENLNFYIAELETAYYNSLSLGADFPDFRGAPNIMIGSQITQEEADAIYASKYMEYRVKLILNNVPNYNGSSNGGNQTTYTITFNSNCSDVDNIFINYNSGASDINWPEPTRNGYIFDRWYYDSACTSPVSTISLNSNYTFYAKWIPRYTTISFNSNCEYVSNTTCTYDILTDNWVFPEMKRNGYIFEGWYWDQACTNKVVEYTKVGDKTFYAKWVPEFKYVVSNNEATITGLAYYKVKNDEIITDIVIPEIIDGYAVTKIGKDAFYKNSLITSIAIPNSVKIIDSAAFKFCTELLSVKLSDTLTTINDSAFWHCEKLEEINLPNSITYIGHSAFLGCSKLKNVTLPNTLTTIEYDTFRKCMELENVNIPASLINFNPVAFRDCHSLTNITVSAGNPNYSSSDGILYNKDKTILLFYPSNKSDVFSVPEGINEIGKHSFYSNINIMEISLPDSVTRINDNAFEECTNLHKVNFGKNNLTIGDYAFSGCKSLDISLPNNIVEIGEYSFRYCGFTNLVIPGSIKKITTGAFYDCDYIEKVIFENGVEYIGCSAFVDSVSLKDVILPESINTIDGAAFLHCISLQNIDLPSNLKVIGGVAFMYSGLQKIDIPTSVTNIYEQAFSCVPIKSIILPDSITSIEPYLFWGSYYLKNIVIPKTINTINDSAFHGCDSLSDVFYTGNKDEWEKVSISTNNEYLTSSDIHYNCVYATDMVKITYDGLNTKVFITPNDNFLNKTIICSFYKNNSLSYVESFTYSGEMLEISTASEYDEIKIIILEDLTTLKPVCNAVEIPINWKDKGDF